jgi:predicted MFS family arabinose efflux permease
VKSKLVKRGFLSLIWTQFFGAANDNILKMVLVFMIVDGIWEGRLGADGGPGFANFMFTVPFILLSGYAGRFADRNSKRDVVVLVKIIEIPIAFVAMIGFWIGSLWITLGALVLLACQSAFFGPAKYGMIPELVESRDLSRANGTINMMTNIAVIIGTLTGSKIADLYSPQAVGDAEATMSMGWLPGTVMVVVAVAGLIAALNLPPLNPGDKSIKYEWNPLGTYISALREMAGTPLFTVMFAWAYFYFLAGLALIVLPEYTTVLASYNVDRTEAGVLLAVMGVAIGLGCVLCGLFSGHAIRPWMVPFGGIGLAICFCLLGLVPAWLPDLPPYWRILASPISFFILGAGICAGFYIVPLQALIQRLTPSHELGRFLGTANGLSFTFLMLSALFYEVIRPAFNSPDGTEHPDKIFLVSAAFMLVGVIFFLWRIKARGFSLSKVE